MMSSRRIITTVLIMMTAITITAIAAAITATYAQGANTRFDPETGTGLISKGTIQHAFGFNN